MRPKSVDTHPPPQWLVHEMSQDAADEAYGAVLLHMQRLNDLAEATPLGRQMAESVSTGTLSDGQAYNAIHSLRTNGRYLRHLLLATVLLASGHADPEVRETARQLLELFAELLRLRLALPMPRLDLDQEVASAVLQRRARAPASAAKPAARLPRLTPTARGAFASAPVGADGVTQKPHLFPGRTAGIPASGRRRATHGPPRAGRTFPTGRSRPLALEGGKEP